MNPSSEAKIILVVRSTRLEDLKARFATKSQAEFYVTSLGGDFGDYEREDIIYQQALAASKEALGRLGRVQVVQRGFLPNFVFGPHDIVVAMGQDGLVANTLKYLDGQPLLGVNPDPKRWDGKLLPFTVEDLPKIVPHVIRDEYHITEVTMAQATLNTGLRLSAVNDLFIGVKSHTSARYCISMGDRQEVQSSSGVIVSTGLGSTGWLRSLLTGASMVSFASGLSSEEPDQPPDIDWDSDSLYYTVREPFPSKTTGTSMVFGKVSVGAPLVIESHMGENGVIFSDGIEQDFLEFNSGTRATIALSERKGRLVV